MPILVFVFTVSNRTIVHEPVEMARKYFEFEGMHVDYLGFLARANCRYLGVTPSPVSPYQAFIPDDGAVYLPSLLTKPRLI